MPAKKKTAVDTSKTSVAPSLPRFRGTKSLRSVRPWLGLATLCLLLLVTGIVLASTEVPNPVPSSIRNQAPFTLYYPDPAKLPQGLTLGSGSFDIRRSVVTYRLYKNGQPVINVSLQAKPSNIDFNGFYDYSMAGRHDTETAYGKAAIGIVENFPTSSLVTEKTWVFITSDKQDYLNDLPAITRSLIPVRSRLSQMFH